MDLMFGVHQRLMVTSSPCSNGIFIIRKISSLMKLRIIAVPVGNEIKSFQMTLGIFFSPRVFCRLSSIITVLKGKYSFFCKYSIWTQGVRHHKALMNPKHQIHSQNGLTLCSNIRIFTYLKNGALLLWNL